MELYRGAVMNRLKLGTALESIGFKGNRAVQTHNGVKASHGVYRTSALTSVHGVNVVYTVMLLESELLESADSNRVYEGHQKRRMIYTMNCPFHNDGVKSALNLNITSNRTK